MGHHALHPTDLHVTRAPQISPPKSMAWKQKNDETCHCRSTLPFIAGIGEESQLHGLLDDNTLSATHLFVQRPHSTIPQLWKPSPSLTLSEHTRQPIWTPNVIDVPNGVQLAQQLQYWNDVFVGLGPYRKPSVPIPPFTTNRDFKRENPWDRFYHRPNQEYNADTKTNTHPCTQAQTQAGPHARTRKRRHAGTQACKHAGTQAGTQAGKQAGTQAGKQARMHTRTTQKHAKTAKHARVLWHAPLIGATLNTASMCQQGTFYPLFALLVLSSSIFPSAMMLSTAIWGCLA